MLQYIFLLLVIQCLNVASWNNFHFNQTVIPPYRTAVTLLNKDIVDKLIKIDLIRDDHILSNLAHELYCTTQEICANLKQATSANDLLMRQISLRIDELFNSIAKSEKETMEMQTNLNKLAKSIDNARIQVQNAEDSVRHKQQQYEAAERDYQKQEEKLKDARICRGRRRKRWGWWRKNVERPLVNGWRKNIERPIENSFKQHVMTPLCSIINHQGIQNAKSSVSTARGSLDEARNTLSKYHHQLQNETGKYREVQSQVIVSQQKLTSLNVILGQQRSAQTVATMLSEKFRAIEVHLDGVSSPSMMLLHQLEMLTAFEAVIEPLNEIYIELLSERMIEPEALQISPQKVNEIKRKLKFLTEKLPDKGPFEGGPQEPCGKTEPHSVTSDRKMDFDGFKTTPLRSTDIPLNLTTNWTRNGVTVAGGNVRANPLSRLSQPYGLFVDENQTVYVADSSNHRIVEWKRGATHAQVVAGGKGPGNRMDQLNRPTDVIADQAKDSLIICDQQNRRVVRWPRRNGTSGEMIISNIRCWGLAMDDRGFLYVPDEEKHEVRRWRLGDNIQEGTVVAGGNGQGGLIDQLNYPSHVFVDRDHSVYVSEWHNHRVTKWVEGALEGVIVAGGQGQGDGLSQLLYPRGVVVDQLGTVYVADTNNQRIMRWPKGVTQGSVIVGGNGYGGQVNQFHNPVGLSFDRYGNLYVVDSSNNRVQEFQLDPS